MVQLFGLIYGILTGIPLYFHGRKQIAKLMRGDSESQRASSSPDEIAVPPRDRATTTSDAPPLPSFPIEELDADDKVIWTDRERHSAYKRNISRRTDSMLALGMRIGGHLLLIYAALLITMQVITVEDYEEPGALAFGIFFVLVVHLFFFLLIVLVSRLTERFDYRDNPLLMVRGGIFMNFFSVGNAAAFEGQDAVWWLLAVPLCAAPIVFYWFSPRWIDRLFTYPAIPRTDLLMLRVFNTGKSRFLTHQIEPLWRFVGSTYTISSEDHFQAQEMRIRTGPLIWFAFCAGIVWFIPAMVLIIAADSGSLDPLAGLIAVVIHALLSYLMLRRPLRRIMIAGYLKSEEDVDAELLQTFLEQRDELDRYSNENLNCQGETWRLAIQKLIPECEAVLMDLRGFQQRNAGIAYEIGLVMNQVPLRQVLMLTDDSTDRDAFLSTIGKAATAITEDSPNVGGAYALKLLRTKRINRKVARRIGALLFRDAAANQAFPPSPSSISVSHLMRARVT